MTPSATKLALSPPASDEIVVHPARRLERRKRRASAREVAAAEAITKAAEAAAQARENEMKFRANHPNPAAER